MDDFNNYTDRTILTYCLLKAIDDPTQYHKYKVEIQGVKPFDIAFKSRKEFAYYMKFLIHEIARLYDISRKNVPTYHDVGIWRIRLQIYFLDYDLIV
jgi:phage head maturation protease